MDAIGKQALQGIALLEAYMYDAFRYTPSRQLTLPDPRPIRVTEAVRQMLREAELLLIPIHETYATDALYSVIPLLMRRHVFSLHFLLAVVTKPHAYWEGRVGSAVYFLDSLGKPRSTSESERRDMAMFLAALAGSMELGLEGADPGLLEFVDVKVRPSDCRQIFVGSPSLHSQQYQVEHQPPDSIVCGLYVLHFIKVILRHHETTLASMVRVYSLL